MTREDATSTVPADEASLAVLADPAEMLTILNNVSWRLRQACGTAEPTLRAYAAAESPERYLISEAMAAAPRHVRRSVERLCGHGGAVRVAVVLTLALLAKSAVLIEGEAYGTIGDRGGEEARRRRTLRSLDDALTAAERDLHGDTSLLDAAAALRVHVRSAARQSRGPRKIGRPGFEGGRAAWVRCLRDLGATAREAEAIFNAIPGVRPHGAR